MKRPKRSAKPRDDLSVRGAAADALAKLACKCDPDFPSYYGTRCPPLGGHSADVIVNALIAAGFEIRRARR